MTRQGKAAVAVWLAFCAFCTAFGIYELLRNQ